MGSEEGREGVVGRTYCILPKNNDFIIVVVNLHRINVTPLTVARRVGASFGW